jgi:NAD+ diphosphatase
MSRFAFIADALDRRADKRDDPEFIAAALADPKTRIVVFSDGECLIESPDTWRLCSLRPHELQTYGIAPWPPVFLGTNAGSAWFAVEIDREQRQRIGRGHLVDIWRDAAKLSEEDAAIFAYARSMLYWHARHLYCGRSGIENVVAAAGHRLLGGEENMQFPRVDPAIIVLVHRGDRCLLGRKTGWPENWYATIAGFVEPGESLEAAVRREVKEETDVDVEDVAYKASQPWPFPSSLMIGFHARASSERIVLNDKELAEARWFNREQIAAGEIRVPPAMSIAFYLIEQWFDRAGEPRLRELAASWG